nr:hypothetical protein 3 [Rhodospirillaceae bacterium]
MPTHIQIGDISPHIQYTADGAQDAFTFPFPIFQDSDLDVFLDDAEQASGFSVSGAGTSDGGEVTFDAPPASGAVVTLTRRLAFERLGDFQESGTLRAKVLNDELDYLTAALQQVNDDQGRALQLSLTETADVDVTLPAPKANTTLMWNADANAMTNGPSADEVSAAQTHALNAEASANAASTSEGNAATSAGEASNSAQIALNAAASNMYASNENKSTDFSVLASDDGKQFLVDTSAGAVTVTLPEGGSVSDGFRVALAKTSVDSNAVIVARSGTDTINGGTTWQFSVPHGQSVISLDTTPTPDVWFAAGVGVVAPVGVGDLHDAAKPYDVAFIAGFDSTMSPEAVAVRSYGQLVVPRAMTVSGEAGYIDVAATGQPCIVDIEKNGVSIYSTKPQFAAGANVLTSGVLSTSTFAAGDRMTFKVSQAGQSAQGSGLRFTVKGVIG